MKPVIIFVGNDSLFSDDDTSPYRDAFCTFARKVLGCEVHVFARIYQFEDEHEKYCKLFKMGLLKAALILNCKYMRYGYMEEASIIRSLVSPSLPLFILTSHQSTCGKPRHPKFYDYEDKELMRKLAVIIGENVTNFYGTENLEECKLLIQQLELTYSRNYPDDHPPTNDIPILQAIRLRLLPPQLIKEEFDVKLRKATVSSGGISVYKEECTRILRMTTQEREIFLRTVQPESMFSCSYGDSMAFAFDPITMEYATSGGFGNHCKAIIDLETRVESLLEMELGGCIFDFDKHEFRNRVIKGLVVREVKGFKFPVLKLYHHEAFEQDESLIHKIGNKILSEKKLIPVNIDGYLVGQL